MDLAEEAQLRKEEKKAGTYVEQPVEGISPMQSDVEIVVAAGGKDEDEHDDGPKGTTASVSQADTGGPTTEAKVDGDTGTTTQALPHEQRGRDFLSARC